jgi:hypothetical protein
VQAATGVGDGEQVVRLGEFRINRGGARKEANRFAVLAVVQSGAASFE